MSSKEKKEPAMEVPQELIEEALQAVEPKKEKKEDQELQDKYIRLAADFDNFRKRIQKEKAEYVRYANENFVKDLLPVLDNFERALEHTESAKDQDAVINGIKLIFSQLQSTLSRFGIRSESMAGKIFDPLTQEAVSHNYSADVPAQTVIQEHQKAYFLHDRLIRPALVTVSKGPENISDPQASQTGIDSEE